MGNKKKCLTLTLCLLLLAVLVIAGAFAIYSSRVDGQSNTKIAPFAFTAELSAYGDSSPIQLATAGSREMGTLTVSNTENGVICGVNTKYTISLNSNVSLPDTVTPSLKMGSETYAPIEISSDRREFTFESQDFTLGFEQTETENYTVVLSWDKTTGGQNFDVVVTATVNAEQVD